MQHTGILACLAGHTLHALLLRPEQLPTKVTCAGALICSSLFASVNTPAGQRWSNNDRAASRTERRAPADVEVGLGLEAVALERGDIVRLSCLLLGGVPAPE